MSRHLVVVDRPREWAELLPSRLLLSAQDYVAGRNLPRDKRVKVINLCGNQGYLGVGYYVSLLAEARAHGVIPAVGTLLELSRKSIYRIGTADIENALQRRLGRRSEDVIDLDVRFGACTDPDLQGLAEELFDLYPAPLLRVRLRRTDAWRIERLRIGSPAAGPKAARRALAEALEGYLVKRWRSPRARPQSRYDLAVLHDPHEALPPSNARALRHFMRAGRRLGVDVDLITRRDYPQVAEWDALFIRETTRINHHTYTFAQRAEAEGLVVIDDPASIRRCTNKVYLAELLRTHGIAAPRTEVLQRGLPLPPGPRAWPVVLKVPDGAFSRGMGRARDEGELEHIAGELFQQSDLLLAQEFVPSQFDWRIGVLDGEPLFACQYFMSRGHWQIYEHKANGRVSEGESHTLPVEQAPAEVVATALRAAVLIGDGLYGVDLKQTERGVYVIEVNDNPNIDAGVEDAVLGERLYERVLETFVQRLERQHTPQP